MPTTVRSHAKINLGLYIGAPRADGFHALSTVYQTLEMHDFVTVSARRAAETAIRLTSNDRRVPTDGRNTAWKMTLLVLEELNLTADVEIHIEKRLPVQGGLGAGSANAVAALAGLERELGIDGLPGLKGETWGPRGLGAEPEKTTTRATAGPSTPVAAATSAQDDSILGDGESAMAWLKLALERASAIRRCSTHERRQRNWRCARRRWTDLPRLRLWHN